MLLTPTKLVGIKKECQAHYTINIPSSQVFFTNKFVKFLTNSDVSTQDTLTY